MTSRTDPLGNTTTYTYDGHPTRAVISAGHRIVVRVGLDRQVAPIIVGVGRLIPQRVGNGGHLVLGL